MPLVDLSHPLTTGMPVYPGDPEVTFAPALTVAADGVAVERLGLGSHSGTHLDAPAHSIPGGRTVDRIPLELLWGPARVLRAVAPAAGGLLGIADVAGSGGASGASGPAASADALASASPDPLPAALPAALPAVLPDALLSALPDALPGIVCIATGWDAHFGGPLAERHPAVSLALAEALWARGARVLAVDTLSPDLTVGGSGMPVHEFWLGNDGVIVENLTGLDAVSDEFELSLLPLRLAGIDGSPVRAVARFA